MPLDSNVASQINQNLAPKPIKPPPKAVDLRKGRAYTKGEIALGKSIFKDEIDFSKSKIYKRKAYVFQPKNVVMAPNGNIYFHPEGDTYLDDFSTGTPGEKGLLIHELTHVWQNQKGVNVRSAVFNRTYKYLPLKAGKAFKDYGLEQQGDIVRDYYFLKEYNFRKKGNKTTLEEYEVIIPFGKQEKKND